jgi:hypothetical protein
MACPFLLAIGFAILLVSEFTGLAALRIVAVGVLLAGAVGGGVRAGLAAEPPALFSHIAARFTARIARVVIVLLMLPVALTLVLAVTGAALHPHGDLVSASALIAGAFVALLLLGVLAAAVALALHALRSAEKAA